MVLSQSGEGMQTCRAFLSKNSKLEEKTGPYIHSFDQIPGAVKATN